MNLNQPESEKEILYHFFNSFSPISPSDFDEVFLFVKRKTYLKGEIILEAGAVETKSYFVLNGVVHHFVYDDEVPLTTNLTPKGFSFNSLKSYVTGCPSQEVQEAVTDVELLYLDKSDINYLVEKFHSFSLLMYKMHEAILLDREDRMFLLQYRNPSKRYSLFHETVQRCNWLLDGAPDKYIASYLNMTPQQYSKEKRLFLKNVN